MILSLVHVMPPSSKEVPCRVRWSPKAFRKDFRKRQFTKCLRPFTKCLGHSAEMPSHFTKCLKPEMPCVWCDTVFLALDRQSVCDTVWHKLIDATIPVIGDLPGGVVSTRAENCYPRNSLTSSAAEFLRRPSMFVLHNIFPPGAESSHKNRARTNLY